jgi:hypothetical protein
VRALCSSSCRHSLLANAAFSIIYNVFVRPTQFLRGFHIDWAHTQVGCQMHFYILLFLPLFLAGITLVLPSFDRYCSSSKSCRLHSTSTIRRARLTILIATVLSVVLCTELFSESIKFVANNSFSTLKIF